MKKYLFFLTVFMVSVSIEHGYAQTDTMIAYTVKTKTIDIVLPVSIDSTSTFNHTPSSIGSLGNQTPLSLVPPTINLFSDSEFSDLERADALFNITDYPIRTACKIFTYKNGVKSSNCSAILVGKDFVLTAAHCVYNSSGQVYQFDSLLVVPGFNNGTISASLSTSIVEKVYIFKTFYDNKTFDDIALLQLQKPIGQQTGWIGMAFNSDTSYFTHKVFHKLSYPGIPNPFDPSKVYNGDTLYYNYGNIDKLPPNNLGIDSQQAIGIPGQSGSSLFYTDNTDFYSFGVLSFSAYYNHYQIKQNSFYQLENILNNYTSSTQDVMIGESKFRIYPNPFSSTTTIQIDGVFKNATITVCNLFGQTVKQIKNISGHKVTILRDGLPSGLYFIWLIEGDKIVTLGKLVITN